MAGLFLIDPDGNLTPLRQSDYDSEDVLQSLLADYPDLLGGDQMGSGAPWQWLFVAREASVPDREGGGGRWSLDHLFLDQDTIPTFVEVKRASDSRIRREVVGQMLDYAANGLRYWPVEAIQGFLASDGKSADDRIAQAFGGDIEPADYWQMLRENTAEGRVRLLFVADRIPEELLAVVEFLNTQMHHTEVLAVEIPQFTRRGAAHAGAAGPRPDAGGAAAEGDDAEAGRLGRTAPVRGDGREAVTARRGVCAPLL